VFFHALRPLEGQLIYYARPRVYTKLFTVYVKES
jgi:hypothetical protein